MIVKKVMSVIHKDRSRATDHMEPPGRHTAIRLDSLPWNSTAMRLGEHTISLRLGEHTISLITSEYCTSINSFTDMSVETTLDDAGRVMVALAPENGSNKSKSERRRYTSQLLQAV